MTVFAGLVSTSSTGARFMLKPSASSCWAWMEPRSQACSSVGWVAAKAWLEPRLAILTIRWMRPPSWSMAMNGGTMPKSKAFNSMPAVIARALSARDVFSATKTMPPG